MSTNTDRLIRTSPIQTNFRIFTKTSDPRFGEISLLQKLSDPNEYIMAKEKNCKTTADCQRDNFQARERIKLSSPCLMTMLDYSCEAISQGPSEGHRVIGYYEYPPLDLQTEINERAKVDKWFTAKELLKMTENVLSALVYLKSFKMIHSDVRPTYISIPKDASATFKLLDRLGEPNSPNRIQINNYRKGKSLYLSPALFEAIANNQNKIRHNPYKSDAFSFGLVLLEAGLLKPIQSLFNKNEKRINTFEFVKLQDQFLKKYNDCEVLKQVLFWLLNVNETDRKEAKDILRLLTKNGGVINEPSRCLEISHSNQSQTESVRVDTQGLFSDQSVQCEKDNRELQVDSVGINQIMFKKQLTPEIFKAQLNCVSPKKRGFEESMDKENEELSTGKKYLLQASKAKCLGLAKEGSDKTDFRHHFFAKVSDSSATEANQAESRQMNQDDRNLIETDNYQLIRKKSAESNRKSELTLEHSNFLIHNKVSNKEFSDQKTEKQKEDFFNFKIETPQKKTSDFFQLSTQKNQNIETPSFNRMFDRNYQLESKIDPNYEKPNNIGQAKKETEIKTEENAILFGTPNHSVVLLQASVYIGGQTSLQQVPHYYYPRTSTPVQNDPHNSVQCPVPIIIKRESVPVSETPTQATIKHPVFGQTENRVLNFERESTFNANKSNLSENGQIIAKEIYLSPNNFKKMQDNTKMHSRVSLFNESELGCEVQTYNYEIRNVGNQSRQYLFKRNSSHSILQAGMARTSNTVSPQFEDGNQGNDGINEKFLAERYGNVQLRLDNQNYKVYRQMDIANASQKTGEVRSHSQNIIRTPVKNFSHMKFVEARF